MQMCVVPHAEGRNAIRLDGRQQVDVGELPEVALARSTLQVVFAHLPVFDYLSCVSELRYEEDNSLLRLHPLGNSRWYR